MGKVRLAFAERFIVLSFPIQCSSTPLLAEKSLRRDAEELSQLFFLARRSRCGQLGFLCVVSPECAPKKISSDPVFTAMYSLLDFAQASFYFLCARAKS